MPAITEQRLFQNIAKDEISGCWEWTGAKDRKGYGRVNNPGGSGLVHRALWSMKRGEIPKGMMLCHHCDNRKCCNPDHLYAGNHADNVRDMVKRRRFEKGENHHASKVSTEEIGQIRSLEGVPYRFIAGLYGISQSLVYLIRSRRTRRFES